MDEPITAPADGWCPVCREKIRAGIDLILALKPDVWVHLEDCAISTIAEGA